MNQNDFVQIINPFREKLSIKTITYQYRRRMQHPIETVEEKNALNGTKQKHLAMMIKLLFRSIKIKRAGNLHNWSYKADPIKNKTSTL
jgi:hypothetical protein